MSMRSYDFKIVRNHSKIVRNHSKIVKIFIERIFLIDIYLLLHTPTNTSN